MPQSTILVTRLEDQSKFHKPAPINEKSRATSTVAILREIFERKLKEAEAMKAPQTSFEAKKSSVVSNGGDSKQSATTENQQLKSVHLPAPNRAGCGMKIDREALVSLQTTFYHPHCHRKFGWVRNHGKNNREIEIGRKVTSRSPRINTPCREACLPQQLPP